MLPPPSHAPESPASCVPYTFSPLQPRMRGQRAAILASQLRELTGFYLAVDCPAQGYGGERTYSVAELAGFYDGQHTVGDVLRRMRCSGGCGRPVAAALLGTWPALDARVRPCRGRHGAARALKNDEQLRRIGPCQRPRPRLSWLYGMSRTCSTFTRKLEDRDLVGARTTSVL
jgi:hypothetical protein